MERFILSKGAVTMDELRGHFNISMNTVRRDVAELLNRGTVEKVYGGVCARRNEQALTPYEVRRRSSEEARAAIGKQASQLVSDGDIIFIVSGTTALHMIDHLADLRELTIIALPGQVRRRPRSFTGDDTLNYLQRFDVRIAFMGSSGLSSHGVTNSPSQSMRSRNAPWPMQRPLPHCSPAPGRSSSSPMKHDPAADAPHEILRSSIASQSGGFLCTT